MSAKVAKVMVNHATETGRSLGLTYPPPVRYVQTVSNEKRVYSNVVARSYSPVFVFCEVLPRRQCDESFCLEVQFGTRLGRRIDQSDGDPARGFRPLQAYEFTCRKRGISFCLNAS